jgi:hypothetical protein
MAEKERYANLTEEELAAFSEDSKQLPGEKASDWELRNLRSAVEAEALSDSRATESV